MIQLTIGDAIDTYNKLVRAKQFENAKKYLDELTTDNQVAKKLIEKCKADLALSHGRISDAYSILKATTVFSPKDSSDIYLFIKYLISSYSLRNKNEQKLIVDKIESIKGQFGKNYGTLHDLANFYGYIGNDKAEDCFLDVIENAEPIAAAAAEYDYARFLLYKGQIRKGLFHYQKRFQRTFIRTELVIDEAKKVNLDETEEYLENTGEINFVSEQGVGDQIRLLYLTAAIAKKINKKINFYCDKRIAKYISSEFINIKPYEAFEAAERAAYAYDYLGYLEDDKRFIHESNIDLHISKEELEIEDNSVGVVFSTISRAEYNELIDVLSPKLSELESEISKYNPSNVYSLQYQLESFDASAPFRWHIKHSKQIDYKNDWDKLFGIAHKMKAVVGPDSTQTILAAITGVTTVMLSPDYEPIYLGSEFDVFQKNVKRVKFKEFKK